MKKAETMSKLVQMRMEIGGEMNEQESIQLLEEMNINPLFKCKYCHSILINKRGSTIQKDSVSKQRYFCKECKRTYVLEPLLPGGRRGTKRINSVIYDLIFQMSKEGYGSIKIHDYFLLNNKINVSPASISRILRKLRLTRVK